MKEGISTGTIIRTIILALALFNQVMTASGHPIINISDEIRDSHRVINPGVD